MGVAHGRGAADLAGPPDGIRGRVSHRDDFAPVQGKATGSRKLWAMMRPNGHYPLSASRRISSQSAATCSRSVPRAPTDTRTIQRPSNCAGVR